MVDAVDGEDEPRRGRAVGAVGASRPRPIACSPTRSSTTISASRSCSIGVNVPLEGIEVYVRSVLGEPFERLVAPFWHYQTAIVPDAG